MTHTYPEAVEALAELADRWLGGGSGLWPALLLQQSDEVILGSPFTALERVALRAYFRALLDAERPAPPAGAGPLRAVLAKVA